MRESIFGYMPDGRAVRQFTMQNEQVEISLIAYAGAIQSFKVGGTDIVCGFDTLEGYLQDTSHQGSLVGRYANRIADGRFTLNGKEYQLEKNAGGGTVHLHGGAHGYSRRLWEVLSVGEDTVTFHMDSPDGDSGYPGHLVLDVTYRLLSDGILIDYTATTDAPTPANFTNHAYFNLRGCGGGEVMDAKVQIFADEYSPLDEAMVPTGHAAVAGTVYDLNTPVRLGDRMKDGFPGFDNNYLLCPHNIEEFDGVRLPKVAEVTDGGLCLSVYTDEPCLQFYMACSLKGDYPFKGGALPARYTAYCFEAQTEPNGPNRGEAILTPSEVYRQTTAYRVKKA